jgi:hypothetical protein
MNGILPRRRPCKGPQHACVVRGASLTVAAKILMPNVETRGKMCSVNPP